MKLLTAAVLVAAGAAALALWADDAEATNNCGHGTGATGNWCQGWAHIRGADTTGTSFRCFSLRTETFAGACASTTGSNLATWQLTAGACQTLYYYTFSTGSTPPPVPNKVTLDVRPDNSNTPVITFLTAGSNPAQGTTYTFCATNDGLVSGSARAGTYRAFVNAVKDDALGGVGNYNWNSDGGGSPTGWDSGILRGQILVSSLTRNSYPSGSTYAYGPSGDESITVTATHTQPNIDNAVETAFTYVADEATLAIGQAGATVDLDATSLAQSFTVDNTFPEASNPYVRGFTLVGNSVRSGLRWTTFAASGHGTDIIRFSDTSLYHDEDIAIDSRIVFDSDGSGTFATADDQWLNKLDSSSGTVVTKFNRGETGYIEGYLFNARDEQLTRTMNFLIEDASAVVCNSNAALSPTAGKYSTTYTVPTAGSCTVANTDAGSERYMRASNTDQNHRSVEDHRVSSLYYVNVHLQDSSTLDTGAPDVLAFFVRSDGAGGDDSDTVYLWCQVQSVRMDVAVDTSGNAVSANIKDPTATTRTTGSGDTDASGFTTTFQSLLASTPLGDDWAGQCTATFNGNTGTETQLFEIDVEGGGGGETVYTGADPLTLFCGNIANGTVPCAVHSRFLNGEARTGAAASIFVSVFTWPDLTPVVTGGAVVEVDATNAPGAYAYNFTAPYTGSYLVSANTTDLDSNPIGAHNVIDLALSEHREGSIELLMTSNFAGLGFDGFIFLLFWIAVLLFASYMGWLVLAAFSIPGILFTAIPSLGAAVPDLDFPTLLTLALLGFILEVAANKWSWGGYQSGKRRLKIGA